VELCCLPALMAGMFGCLPLPPVLSQSPIPTPLEGLSLAVGAADSNVFGGLPFIMNGTISCHLSICMSTELSMALKAPNGPVIQCHSLVLMTGTKVPLWDPGIISLLASWPEFGLLLPCTPAIWSGCWFFVWHPNFPHLTLLQFGELQFVAATHCFDASVSSA